MVRPVHYRVPGTSATRSNPTACLQIGFNVTDTDAVTCPACHLTTAYIQAHARHCEVVAALAYPKEDHPCLTSHHPLSTSSSSPPRTGRGTSPVPAPNGTAKAPTNLSK